MDEFIGIIKLFAGNFAPQGWLPCHGQLLNIQQYAAVYAILGTTYGGDGRNTFALPDLRSRIPIGVGQGTGLANYTLGGKTGVEKNTLNSTNMPPLSGTATINQLSGKAEGNISIPVNATIQLPCNDSAGGASSPNGNYLGVDTSNPVANYATSAAPNKFLAPMNISFPLSTNVALPLVFTLPITGSVAIAGSNAPVNNIQPVLGLNYIICVEGLFPSRP
jgi:microcystin-dependent protein